MTIYMSLRQRTVGGGVKDPSFFEGDGNTKKPRLTQVPVESIVARIGERDVLFAIHGFNVSFAEGVCALARLESIIDLPQSCQFIGILWPGDSWLPVVNYPFEGSTAIDCGKRLADFCNRKLFATRSISFFSHSLGGRLALEAIKNLSRKARLGCLAAAAINDDCLHTQYSGAAANADALVVLASRKDLVLKLAYPIGDPIANVLYFDHKPFKLALGYKGPQLPLNQNLRAAQIPDQSSYDHGDYLPSSNPETVFKPAGSKCGYVAKFVNREFNGQPQAWP